MDEIQLQQVNLGKIADSSVAVATVEGAVNPGSAALMKSTMGKVCRQK